MIGWNKVRIGGWEYEKLVRKYKAGEDKGDFLHSLGYKVTLSHVGSGKGKNGVVDARRTVKEESTGLDG